MATTAARTKTPAAAKASEEAGDGAAEVQGRGRKAQAAKRSVATPWGAAGLVEEVVVPQRVGQRRFSVVVQLLEAGDGERLVRFAYSTDGSARRGPVTMRARDLGRLRAALERAPVLAQALAAALADAGAREDT
jgi:hypothetical protein